MTTIKSIIEVASPASLHEMCKILRSLGQGNNPVDWQNVRGQFNSLLDFISVRMDRKGRRSLPERYSAIQEDFSLEQLSFIETVYNEFYKQYREELKKIERGA